MNLNNKIAGSKLVNKNTNLNLQMSIKENETALLAYSKMSIDEKDVFTQALILSNQTLKSELKTRTENPPILLDETTNSSQTENNNRILVLERDHSASKKAEKKLELINKKLSYKLIKRTTQYSFLSEINQSIVYTDNDESLFRKCCSVAFNVGKFKMTWIGLFDEKDQKINLVTQEGIPEADLKIFDHIPYAKNGPQDFALETGEYYICNNITRDFKFEFWIAFAKRNEFQSFMVLPIKKGGKIIGTFNLYSSDIDFFDKEEIELLTKIVDDISFALDLFEKERKHKEIENLIFSNEKRFRALIENGTDGLAVLSAKGAVTYISSSITPMLGYSEEEALKLDVFQLVHHDDAESMTRIWKKVLESKGIPVNGYTCRLKHKNGKWIWVEAMLTNMLHDPAINGIIDNFRDVTQTIIAENNREFDRNNLHSLINTTNDLMWSVDTQLNLITFNRSFSDKLKTLKDKKVAVGDYVFSINITLEEEIRFKTFYNRAFAGEAFMEIEYTEFPEESWQQISFYPINNGKKIIGSACYSRDITQLKTIEKRFKQSEIFSKGILNSLNAHIAVVDHSGTIISVNQAWNRYGNTNGAIYKKSGVGSNYFDECERAAGEGITTASLVLKGMKEVLIDKSKDFYIEYTCHSQTEKRWFATNVTKFESGEQLLVVTHTDISQRKHAEENLLNSQEKLKEAQTLAHLGSWQLDFKENILHLSDEGCRILEICNDNNQITFKEFSSVIHKEDLIFVLGKIKKSRDTKTDSSYSYRILTKDSGIRYIYSESKFIFGYDDKAIGLYGILQDITERKIAEVEREKISADITRRNQDLEQFSFMVSHNLRAPVANILGLSELITDDSLDANLKREVIGGISESVAKLDEVITDLNYILQKKTQSSQKKELVDLKALTLNITNSIEKLIRQEKVVVSYDFESAPNLLSVKSYLHSIFYNLIHNSIKYRRLNTISTIDIKSSLHNSEITLVFKDNGIGMDISRMGSKIFGMYKRFHPQISEGKGIGLYMVKTQIESLGGTISVISEVNNGTTFTVTLPVE